jgi:quinol monooxygenase YgiN
MILIVVKFTIRPSRSHEWLSLVEDFTRSTRAEPGNLFFEWSQSTEVPHQFVLVEGFANAEAGEAHVHSDHFKRAMSWMPEVIATTPEIINVEAPGQQGWGQMGELTPTAGD